MLFLLLATAIAIPPLLLLIFYSGSLSKKIITALVIPWVLISVYYVWISLNSIKSQPIEKVPEDYVFIYGIEDAPKYIYMWVYDREAGYPKTVVLPWTEQNSKKVGKAMSGAQQGLTYGKDKKKGKLSATQNESGELIIYELNSGKHPSKQ